MKLMSIKIAFLFGLLIFVIGCGQGSIQSPQPGTVSQSVNPEPPIPLEPGKASTKSWTVLEFMDIFYEVLSGTLPNCSPLLCISQWEFFSEAGQTWDFNVESELRNSDNSPLILGSMSLLVFNQGYDPKKLEPIKPTTYIEYTSESSLSNWVAPKKGNYIIALVVDTIGDTKYEDYSNGVFDWFEDKIDTIYEGGFEEDYQIPLWTLTMTESAIPEHLDDIIFQVQPVSVDLDAEAKNKTWDTFALGEYQKPDLRIEFSIFISFWHLNRSS